tara:strand:+ start:326 stop:997 length:672 start_codon:yes stop_codon:yes gene_type:complete
MDRAIFYQKQLIKYIKNKDAKILVLGAGTLDKNVFKTLKYKNVTYSNIDNTNENNLNFFTNIHEIKLKDNEFDYCVAHACIHHSSKPHNAILELYRVSRRGSLIIESSDSLLSQIACKLNFSEEYELSAVKKNITSGGVDNSNVPNYVYRWTEREVSKLIKSYKPKFKHRILFDYGHNIKFSNSVIVKLIFYIFFFFFKKQQNLFSIFIDKEFTKNNLNDWIK